MFKTQSMDIRSCIYGYTKLYLWIYEAQSIDIWNAIDRYL